MSQENTQMSVENKYNRDSGVYFTAGVVVKLMILGVIFFAVAIAGFIASTANCTVRHEGTWVNTCQFESRASWAVGTGATVAGGREYRKDRDDRVGEKISRLQINLREEERHQRSWQPKESKRSSSSPV
ncbi:hypothetical protein C7M84_011320 [Penaeus vannamei]|uniref:Uncharacterized protein n=1 Tax=Penaeus vannamei TaxID=6689 RepID=A0A423T1M8_PENVA|nr:hypothetical protein C7M84_011320 [Penaeus vannamei]